MKKGIEKGIVTTAAIVVGNGLLAFMVTAFALPNDIVMGGVTGIGIVLNKLTGADMALSIFVLNIVCLILGGLILGKRFFLMTVASSLIYPVLLGVLERIPGINSLTDNKLLAAAVGGCVLGVALGLVLRVGASTGGVDALNLILHKWFRLPVSVFVYLVDAVILLWQAFFTDIENVLYGIVLLVLETLVLDRVMVFGRSQIQIFVISERFEEIRKRMLSELNAGVTMLLLESGYTKTAQKGVLCILQPRKLYVAKELIESVDPNAFLTITQVKEVHGRGFTMDRSAHPAD